MKRTAFIALAVSLAALVSAQTESPKSILERADKVRNDGIAEMQKAKDYSGYSKLMDQYKGIIKDALKGVDPTKIDPKDAYEWAKLYDKVEEHKTVCDLTHCYLSTHPGAEETFNDKMLMMKNCNALGEADMLQTTLLSTKPVEANDNLELGRSVSDYVDTIDSKLGARQALRTLDKMEGAIKLPDPNEVAKTRLQNDKSKPVDPNTSAPTDDAKLKAFKDQALAGNQSIELDLTSERAKLLQEEGKHAQAVSALQDFEKRNPDLSNNVKHEADMITVQYQIQSSPAIELKFDRQVGQYTSLAAEKGKVVMIDFFAHWCGPCMSSVPGLVSLYGDLHSKGLEIVGVTSTYGFFGKDRGITPDQEFAKLQGLLTEKNMTWPIVVGPKDNGAAYGVYGIPETVLIDKKGVVRNVWVGYDPDREESVRKTVEALLKE